jgi:hexosaminidase
MTPKLFPVPRHLAFLGGKTAVPAAISYSVADSELAGIATFFAEERGLLLTKKSDGFVRFELSAELSPKEEAHRIVVDADGILLQAATPAGAFRATRTLKTLLAKGVTTLPRLEIRDHPAFPNRGLMLDVSRCKMPTMETLFSLIDLLADLKYNELQLYVEHTFAFADHETVWKDASPLTPEEILTLDERCRERFIELVPNLNSFGHFERWLRHEPYKHLAECPEGFRREEPFIVRDHGSTLKPNADSLAFIDSLYAEYLPNFSSRRFNVGMDEPWELGQGWSQPEIEKRGKHAVYLEHLDGIRKLVEKHDREMLFWADILLEKSENASHVPKSASPVIWGYEAEHPFDKQAKNLADCGLSYYLAPGTATWRSFTGRLTNALANLRSATEAGLAHNASGILLSAWGDCGNHQPWSSFYPALINAAGLAWNETSNPEGELARTLDQFLFPNETETPSEALVELGRLDLALGPKIVNASLPWLLLFADQPEKLSARLQADHPAEKLRTAQEILSSLRPHLQNLAGKQGNLGGTARELLLGLDLSSHSLSRGLAMLGKESADSLHSEHDLVDRYRKTWLERARPGGLQESADLLRHALARQG